MTKLAWGIGLIIGGLGFMVSGATRSGVGGAYGAGAMGGALFGLVMLGAGIYRLVVGIRELSYDEGQPMRKKKRKRRPRDENDD